MADSAGVRLVPLDRNRHDLALEALIEDPLVLRYTRVPDPVPEGFVDGWLTCFEDGRRDGTREAFALEDGDGAFLGLAVAPRIDPRTQTAELGYVVARDARGRGVASEALRVLTRWAFEERGVLRLELLISVENQASKAVARRAGYAFEGVMRSVFVKEGRREDTELWSRLPDDPEP